MDITSPISGNHMIHTSVTMAGSAKMSAIKPDDAAKRALEISLNENKGVEAMTDDIDLSAESFGELGKLFEKAFSLPSPPMPEFKEEA